MTAADHDAAMRADFEAWAAPLEFDLRRPNKTYVNTVTDYAWMGWQAATRRASERTEALSDALSRAFSKLDEGDIREAQIIIARAGNEYERSTRAAAAPEEKEG